MTNKKKILLIILILLVVAIPIVAYFLNKESTETLTENTVILDNKSSYSRGVDEAVFLAITNAAYKTVTLNVEKPESIYHATIRKDTFKGTEDGISFILDIPTLKLSFEARQAVDDKKAPVSDALIKCVQETDKVYEGSVCTDSISTTPGSIDSVFELGKELPLTGQNYVIDYTSSTESTSGFIIVITYYTDTGKQEALDALTSLGYNPAEYTITYQAG